MQVILSPPSFDYLAAVYQMPSPSRVLAGGGDSPPTDAMSVEDESEETERERPRALVVDDAPDVTEMIAMFLEHAGYDAFMAFSAPEALEVARENHFEVIVSDIGMPGMNGYELAKALRTLPDYESVPMIAVTGFSVYDDRGRAIQSGFNAHMTKPINPMTLLDLIKSLREGDNEG
ncbi:MAG TPA: response regulator [Pyrinomonadaceae bacterium]|nr:response regulator [Pyrinomonadaceae bacterium]